MIAIGDRTFEPVIGLELHVQLATRSKMFCGCATRFDAAPNTQVCPVCLGFPGALPVPNRRAVALGARLALALGATLHDTSVFDRKSYFYPDLPKGYQITQQRRPLATGGELSIGRPIPLRRLHLEEDAGRSQHGAGGTLVDLNRAGVPLVELVTEPALRSPEEAAAFMRQVRRIVRYLDVSDGNMEQGSLRCDANISLREVGSATSGTRVEIKNLNSFRFVSQALAHEIARHAALLRAGESVAAETRTFDETRGVTAFMRSKEGDHDYRYFPDPDLLPLQLGPEFFVEQRSALVELPDARAARYQADWGLSAYDAGVLTADRATADWFEEGVAALESPDSARIKALANLVMGDVARRLKESGRTLASLPFGPARLVALNALVAAGTLSGEQARKVLDVLWSEDGDPSEIAAAHGWRQVSDADALDAIVRSVLDDHPDELAKYRAGKTKLRGFFVGQVMKRSRGAANPKIVNQRLDTLLAE